jgi:hypothetical protein
MGEWRRYDRDAKADTTPPGYELVWILDWGYNEGVNVGYFDGFTFREWGGSDDVNVSHWAPLGGWPEPVPDCPENEEGK